MGAWVDDWRARGGLLATFALAGLFIPTSATAAPPPLRAKVLVTCVGAFSEAEASGLEDEIVAHAHQTFALDAFSGRRVQQQSPGLAERCGDTGTCMAVLAQVLDSRFVITCNPSAEAAASLRMWDLEQAEVIASVPLPTLSPGEVEQGVQALLQASEGAMRQATELEQLTLPKSSPHEATHLQMAGVEEERWQLFSSVVPFWVAVATTTALFVGSVYVSGQFYTYQGSYNLRVTGQRPTSGSTANELRAKAESSALLGNVLWSVTLGSAVLTTLVGVFTDWPTALGGESAATVR